MTDTIEITGLCKTYRVEGRTVEVLRDLDLTVPAREITVLLGRSGCGKTTLLRLIGGLEKADSGTIRRPPDSRTAFVKTENANPSPPAAPVPGNSASAFEFTDVASWA